MPLRLLALLGLLLAGCRSAAISHATESIQILSEPPGASFWTNTGHSGVTPAVIVIDASRSMRVTFVLDGYEVGQGVLPQADPGYRIERRSGVFDYDGEYDEGMGETVSTIGWEWTVGPTPEGRIIRADHVRVELVPLPDLEQSSDQPDPAEAAPELPASIESGSSEADSEGS